MHPKKVDRFIKIVAKELNKAGVYSPKAENKARDIVYASVNGMKLTRYVVADFLKPVGKNMLGEIEDDFLRAKVAIDISRIWVYMTSDTANNACLRLHLDTMMTKKAAAKWLLEKGFISELIYDSFILDHYHGGVDGNPVVKDDQTGMEIDFGKQLKKDPRRGLNHSVRKLNLKRRVLSGT